MFVQAEKGGFYRDGEKLLLRGVGVGSYLALEHFMLGLPGLDADLRQALEKSRPGCMAAFEQAFFSAKDAQYLRSLGVNLIRVPVSHALFRDDATGAWRKEGFAALRRLRDICDAAGLYYLPDLHTVPGAQNPDWHSGSATGTAEFWRYASLRRDAAELWGRIARELRDSPMLLGYDLLNEPVLPSGGAALLNDFYRDAAAQIRREDGAHMLLLEGDRFSMDFREVEGLEDPNWSYTFHYYPGVWEEGLLDEALGEEARQAGFERALGQILSSFPKQDKPLLCGECGYELRLLPEAFGARLTSQTLSLLSQRGCGWCLWCYKDAGFMSLVSPAPQTPWAHLAQAVARDWDHHRAARAGEMGARLLPLGYPLTEVEVYRVQFTLRALASRLDAEHILRPALARLTEAELLGLPESFRLDNCRVREPLEAVLRTTCAAQAR